MKQQSTNVPRGTSAPGELHARLRALLPDLPEPVLAAMDGHHAQLRRWNRTHNLTRVEAPEQAALLHYADSLLPLLELPAPERVVDLGSGTGLPGLAAAALWPASQVLLVETVAKKCSFLRTVRALVPGLRHEVVQGRSERLEPLEADLVISRATFPWAELPPHAARHLRPGGALIAYLGRDAPDPQTWCDLCEKSGLLDARIDAYTLPDGQTARHLARARRS